MYSEFAIDPKVQMMSEAYQRRFIMILCMRCNDYATLHDDEIAFQLRISNDEWKATKAVFIGKNLIDEHNSPIAWDKRQFRSDSSAERVSRHRQKKKQACNVTVTPPEADTDTDTDTEEPHSVGESSATPPPEPEQPPGGTRQGRLCGILRKAGMADAAVSYLDAATWTAILAKRTDAEIVEIAIAKMAARPGQRTGLKYIAPALLEDPVAIAVGLPQARASPDRRKTLTETRIDTIAALTGKSRTNEHTTPHERDITGECLRIA